MLRVVKVFPQLQVTSVGVYSGWMPVFKILSLSRMAAGSQLVNG
ncbi:hypothetical protein DFR72_102328 [Lentzea flaviverrucosa]|uniref:Uncharacterized protein n=1 Tax=Lentzea flaviverrucosa TaxID=200379 RepID=A0A1H9RN89_9PSEU|nr:hypothetical protein DFR72_102328 [Lentzea flaviverrucosa]SER74206.1 hypothetical protein SAMN05216195_106329 [Lentzea flaviverrucosa]